MKKISKSNIKEKINSFFSQDSFSSEEVKKIKKLANANRIRLGSYKKLFCKSCLSQLAGKIRIQSGYKIITCNNCQTVNKIKL